MIDSKNLNLILKIWFEFSKSSFTFKHLKFILKLIIIIKEPASHDETTAHKLPLLDIIRQVSVNLLCFLIFIMVLVLVFKLLKEDSGITV